MTANTRFRDADVLRSPFFAMHITQDVQGYLEGLDRINGALRLLAGSLVLQGACIWLDLSIRTLRRKVV